MDISALKSLIMGMTFLQTFVWRNDISTALLHTKVCRNAPFRTYFVSLLKRRTQDFSISVYALAYVTLLSRKNSIVTRDTTICLLTTNIVICIIQSSNRPLLYAVVVNHLLLVLNFPEMQQINANFLRPL